MGAARSIQGLDVSRLKNPNSWEVVENAGQSNILRNTSTGQQAEEYILALDGAEDLLKQYEVYEFRLHQSQNLVRVLHVQKESAQYICSGTKIIRVMTERILFRLSDIKNMSHPQAIFTLQQALIGFRVIFQRIGPIWIQSQLICYTPTGRVKVWLNENLARNEPQFDNRSIRGGIELRPSEAYMVNELFKIVELQCTKQQFPSIFKARLERQQILTFFQAIAFLNDYVEIEEVQVANFVRLPKVSQEHAEYNDNGYKVKQKLTNTTENIPNIIFQQVPRIKTQQSQQVSMTAFQPNHHEVKTGTGIAEINKVHNDRNEYMMSRPVGLPPRMVRHKATKSISDLTTLKVRGEKQPDVPKLREINEFRKQSEEKQHNSQQFSFKKQLVTHSTKLQNVKTEARTLATCQSKDSLGVKPNQYFHKIRAESAGDKAKQPTNRFGIPLTNSSSLVSTRQEGQLSEGIKVLNRLSSQQR